MCAHKLSSSQDSVNQEGTDNHENEPNDADACAEVEEETALLLDVSPVMGNNNKVQLVATGCDTPSTSANELCQYKQNTEELQSEPEDDLFVEHSEMAPNQPLSTVPPVSLNAPALTTMPVGDRKALRFSLSHGDQDTSAGNNVRQCMSAMNLKQQRPNSGGLLGAGNKPRVRQVSEGQAHPVHLFGSSTVPAFSKEGHPIADVFQQAQHAKQHPSKVRKYYRRQSELLENYKLDEDAVQEFLKIKERQMNLRASSKSLASAETNALENVDKVAAPVVVPVPLLGPRVLVKDVMDQTIPSALNHSDTELDNDDGLNVQFHTAADEPPARRGSKAPAHHKESSTSETAEKTLKEHARFLAKLSFIVNVLLLCAKLTATILSGSYSIISSLVDSCVDLTSGLVIWLTERAIRKRDPYLYPRGRTRLEPLALVVISVVMAVASIQVIVQSSQAAIIGEFNLNVSYVTVALMGVTIVAKFVLFLLCWRHRQDPSVAVLAQDHRNDCVSNSVAIVCAVLAHYCWTYIDPLGAIVVSIYIAATWFVTGYGQMKMLSGKTANSRIINRVLKIALEHDGRIQCIDTIYVYHFGIRFLVEMHIVLPALMTLREAHDISEPLQNKIESLDYVERAFVHVDYDTEHRPEDEHKVC